MVVFDGRMAIFQLDQRRIQLTLFFSRPISVSPQKHQQRHILIDL
jgi:hypothetical protein